MGEWVERADAAPGLWSGEGGGVVGEFPRQGRQRHLPCRYGEFLLEQLQRRTGAWAIRAATASARERTLSCATMFTAAPRARSSRPR
ncbi:hypothetical protein ACQ86D_43570 [Streptomyces galilaeus]